MGLFDGSRFPDGRSAPRFDGRGILLPRPSFWFGFYCSPLWVGFLCPAFLARGFFLIPLSEKIFIVLALWGAGDFLFLDSLSRVGAVISVIPHAVLVQDRGIGSFLFR